MPIIGAAARGEYTQHEREVFHVGAFSDAITGCLRRPAAKTSGIPVTSLRDSRKKRNPLDRTGSAYAF